MARIKENQIKRFAKSEVMLHWANALPFLILLGTGIFLAWEGFEHEARDPFISDIHKLSGILLIILPPLVLIFGKTKIILKDFKEIFTFGASDWGWMKAQPKGEHGPPQGKFNPGQKINAILAITYSLALQGTGIWLWVFPQGLLPRWTHIAITAIALFLIAGHVFMATLNPSTRPGLRGIFTCWVPRSYMEEHHQKQLEEIEKGEA